MLISHLSDAWEEHSSVNCLWGLESFQWNMCHAKVIKWYAWLNDPIGPTMATRNCLREQGFQSQVAQRTTRNVPIFIPCFHLFLAWYHHNNFHFSSLFARWTKMLSSSDMKYECLFSIAIDYAMDGTRCIYLHGIDLTHWGWEKMDTISQTPFFKCIFLNENVWIPVRISLKFVPKGPINSIPALV